MIRRIICCILLISSSYAVIAQSQYGVEKANLYSRILSEGRELLVMLPKEYKETYSTYPIVYILDSESRFAIASEVLRFLMDNHFMPPHIVVGIKNTDRFRDMTPVDSVLAKSIYPTRGGADNFLAVFQSEIIPFLKKNYRANSRNILIGHGYSGNFILNAFIKGNDTFDKYLCFSPMLWWNNRAVLSDMEIFLKDNSIAGKYLFLAFGKESEKMKKDGRKLENILSRNAVYAINWDCMWLLKEDHYTLYRQSLTKGLESIYKDYRYPAMKELVSKGVEGAKEYEKKMWLKYGRKELLPFSLLESVCIRLKQEKQYNNALLFLKYSAYCYPKKSEVYFYIGEIYEEMQNLDVAVQFFEEAAKRETNRWDYKRKLENIKKTIENIKAKVALDTMPKVAMEATL